jgi:predicted outer membrane protein
MRTVVAALILSLASFGSARAGAESDVDRQLALETLSAALLEVKLSLYQAQNGASAPLKDVARRIVKDRLDPNLELAATARRLNAGNLPIDLAPHHKTVFDKAAGFSNAQLDQQYATDMTTLHASLLDLHRKLGGATDAQLKALGTKSMKMLEEHEKALANAVKAPGK